MDAQTAQTRRLTVTVLIGIGAWLGSLEPLVESGTRVDYLVPVVEVLILAIAYLIARRYVARRAIGNPADGWRSIFGITDRDSSLAIGILTAPTIAAIAGAFAGLGAAVVAPHESVAIHVAIVQVTMILVGIVWIGACTRPRPEMQRPVH